MAQIRYHLPPKETPLTERAIPVIHPHAWLQMDLEGGIPHIPSAAGAQLGKRAPKLFQAFAFLLLNVPL